MKSSLKEEYGSYLDAFGTLFSPIRIITQGKSSTIKWHEYFRANINPVILLEWED